MATDTWSIVGRVGSKIEVDSSITSGMMATIVEDNVQDLSNYTGETISTSDIGSKFHPILTDLTALYVMGRQTGIGADFDYRVADVSITKGGDSSSTKQMEFLASRVKTEMSALGKVIRITKTEPAV